MNGKKSAILFHKTVKWAKCCDQGLFEQAMSSVSGYEIGGLAGAVEEIIIMLWIPPAAELLYFTSFQVCEWHSV